MFLKNNEVIQVIVDRLSDVNAGTLHPFSITLRVPLDSVQYLSRNKRGWGTLRD